MLQKVEIQLHHRENNVGNFQKESVFFIKDFDLNIYPGIRPRNVKSTLVIFRRDCRIECEEYTSHRV